MAAKIFSVIAEPGLTCALIIERKLDGKFWNASSGAWQDASVDNSMTENAGYSANYSEYHSAAAPNAPCIWMVTATIDGVADTLIDRGEFHGDGLAHTETAVSGYIAFSTAYNEVKTQTDGLVGTAEAKQLVNEALRIIANDRHWDWKLDDDPYTLTTANGTQQYTLPVSVKQVVGAYSDKYPHFAIVQYPNFQQLRFNNRTSGFPNKLYLVGQNVVMPDPIPDDAYSIYVIYQKLFALSADSDTFPCPHDFVDCIKTMAKWMACSRKGKTEIANHLEQTWRLQLHNLRTAELSGEFFVPGDPGYGMGAR